MTDLLNSAELAAQVAGHPLFSVLDPTVVPKLRALWRHRQQRDPSLRHDSVDDLVNRNLLELLQSAENLIQRECGSLGRHPPEGSLRLAHHCSTTGTLVADDAATELEIAVDGATALVGRLFVADRPVELVCDFNNRAAWQWQARL